MDASDILPVSSEDEDEPSDHLLEPVMDPQGGDLLLGSSFDNRDLRTQHPDPIQGFRLWQAFLDNVNPLTKVIHTPSVQQSLLEAMGNLDKAPKAIESLMFSIYACATYSMSNNECETAMGVNRHTALTRFQSAARLALMSAGFMRTSNITVLQAFVLFLVITIFLLAEISCS